MLTLEDVAKSVKEATDALQKAQADNQAKVEQMVEQKLKEVLRNHPGKTEHRTIEFDGQMPNKEEEILAKMPAEVQKEMDSVYIMSKLFGRSPKELKSWGSFVQKAGDFKKALDTSTAGGVLEWIPTGFSPNLQALIRLQLKVAALFPTIQMPTNPYKLPVQIGRFKSYKHAEQTADTGQTKITKGDANSISAATTFTAVAHATEVLASDESTEDSIVPLCRSSSRRS